MKKLSLLMLVFGAIVLSGCAPPQTSGTLILQITDAPAELNIEKVLVTLSKVSVHAAGMEDENTSEAGWFAVMEEPKTFDLIEIKDVKTFLGSAELSIGKYTQVRLDVDQAWATIDGVEYNLLVPSESVKLIQGFTIEANKTTVLTLDFDAQESIHSTGKDKYLMKPTIKIIQE